MPINIRNSFVDIMGFRIGMQCSSGYEMLNQSVERDQHHLKPDGSLSSPSWIGGGYCFEAFTCDNRSCPDGNTFITAVKCYESPANELKFQISFVVSNFKVLYDLTLLISIICSSVLTTFFNHIVDS